LCESVRDVGGEDGDAQPGLGDDRRDHDIDEGDDSEDRDGASADADVSAARVAAFTNATEALKAAVDSSTQAEGAATHETDDVITMDQDTMFQQLLGDEDDGESLLASFASSGLEGPEASGLKLSKRQRRIKQRQEDTTRKFSELDLLESFLSRFVDKRNICVEMLRELHEALATTCRRAAGSPNKLLSHDSADGGKDQSKKMSRMDASLRQLESALAQRIAKLLLKALRQVCRPNSINEVCSWHTADEWAEYARTLFSQACGFKVTLAGQRLFDVGALLLYFFCAAHNAALEQGKTAVDDANGPDGNDVEQGWTLAEELLKCALQDWSVKKDSERWSEAVLTVFVARAPLAVVRLPWLDQIRASATRKTFVQRAQVSFFANHLLQGLPSGLAARSAAAVAADFANLCAELLETTLEGIGSESRTTAGSTPSGAQKQKVRREALRGLKVALRARAKQQTGIAPMPEAAAGRIAATVTKVRDALPARHGEVYQLCLHVLRSVQPEVAHHKPGNTPEKQSVTTKRPRASSDTGSEAAKRLKEETKDKGLEAPDKVATSVGTGGCIDKKVKTHAPKSGPQVKKGNKQFFSEM